MMKPNNATKANILAAIASSQTATPPAHAPLAPRQGEARNSPARLQATRGRGTLLEAGGLLWVHGQQPTANGHQPPAFPLPAGTAAPLPLVRPPQAGPSLDTPIAQLAAKIGLSFALFLWWRWSAHV